MARKLTKKRREFANKVLESDNATQAAKEVFEITNDNYAKVKAFREMHKPEVIAYLEENARSVASNMVHLALNAESEMAQISAGKDVLDRAGFKTIEKSINVNVEVEGDDEIAQQFDAYLKNRLRQSGTQEHTRLDS